MHFLFESLIYGALVIVLLLIASKRYLTDEQRKEVIPALRQAGITFVENCNLLLKRVKNKEKQR